MRLARTALASLLLAGPLAGPTEGQSALERTPNLDGTWVSEAGVGHFNLVHRFWVTDPPARKVINTPTLFAGAGLGAGLLVGLRYGSNSSLVPGKFNEWEAFGRWRPLTSSRSGLADVSLSGGWNGVAESVDGELAVARDLGPFRLHLSARVFSAFAGGDGDAAVGGGALWRFGRHVAVGGDIMTVVSGDTTVAWSVGLQLGIPYTPHTVSLHATNAGATTLQSSSFGGGQRLYGFEFTVPITFSRYFGGREATTPAPGDPGPAPADTAVVGMDNRLRFLPDTIRVRVGTAVRWENGSDVIHTVTADPDRAARAENVSLPDGVTPFDSGDIVPGGVYTRVFRVPGTYAYVCLPHELVGMVGVVIVTD
jgi:plastocyanin